jgi:hypothetical protein
MGKTLDLLVVLALVVLVTSGKLRTLLHDLVTPPADPLPTLGDAIATSVNDSIQTATQAITSALGNIGIGGGGRSAGPPSTLPGVGGPSTADTGTQPSNTGSGPDPSTLPGVGGPSTVDTFSS